MINYSILSSPEKTCHILNKLVFKVSSKKNFNKAAAKPIEAALLINSTENYTKTLIEEWIMSTHSII